MFSLQSLSADAHRDDLMRAAAAHRSDLPAGPRRMASGAAVSLRPLRGDEEPVVARLAALDDQTAPTGPILLALIDDEPVAALALESGAVVANPFLRTDDAVQLLRLRARLLAPSSRRRPRPVWRPRAA